MDAEQQLKDLMRERILVLDGAMGTLIQRYELSEEQFRGERFADHPRDLKGSNEALNLTRPDIIRGIHDEYLDAGADIITTNTFNGTAVSLAEYGLADEAEEINRTAAALAREAADAAAALTPNKPRFVAGSLGPTNKTASISPDVNDPGARNVTWDELVAAYKTAARGLVAGGVDILLIETIFDTLNGKAAIFAVESLFEELGCRAAGDRQRHDRRPVGTKPERPDGRRAVELRCATPGRSPLGSTARSAREMLRPYVAELARIADVPVVTYPNAGLPNAFGGYDEQPPETSRSSAELAREGALNIVGSCCGTTPDHTRAIVAAVEGLPPRAIPTR